MDFPHQSEHQELAATKTQVEDLEGVAGDFLRRLWQIKLVLVFFEPTYIIGGTHVCLI
jgi:hypothetical protein